MFIYLINEDNIMRIAVCDDEEKENINLTRLIYDYADKNRINMDVYTFTSGDELIKEDKFDIYFLDFILPGMNGTEIALALKEKFGDNLTLCYLTSYERAAIQVINSNISPIGFLTKPCSEEELCNIFNKLQKKSFFNSIMLKKEGNAFIYYPQDIIYAEAMRKTTAIHTFNSNEDFRINFTEMENDYLPKSLFAKVHRSYIINLMHVRSYNKKEITMKNGDIIPISRSINFDRIIDSFRFESFSK